ncbi:MAG: GIY-YIG nuclease family protein [Deltaproteobacteria bacterium]|nr:GIY-YIG nuclease family protein [Deltaproteobacteria bacterium]
MLAIKNYGQFWERKYIHYGRSGNAGHLKGYNGRDIVDFRNQRGVYVLYDKDMKPIYVGQSGKGKSCLFKRLDDHNADHLSGRWEYFSWFGLCDVDRINNSLIEVENSSAKLNGTIADSLNEIESALILAMEPKLNKKGASWKGVWEYCQYTEDEKEVTIVDVVNEQKKLKKELSEIKTMISKL